MRRQIEKTEFEVWSLEFEEEKRVERKEKSEDTVVFFPCFATLQRGEAYTPTSCLFQISDFVIRIFP
jgi:hypothetical protein